MLDVLGPAAGTGRQHAPLTVRAGGSAVNVARAARAAGASAAVVGRIGDDDAGAAIRAALRNGGIEDRLAVQGGGRTGCVVRLGEAIVADRGANAGLTPGDVRLSPAAAVVLSGFVLFREDATDAGRAALASPALTCVDLAAAGLVRPELLASADVVVGDADAVEAAGGLEALASGRTAAVRTLGADGAEAVWQGQLVRAQPPVRHARDPWGAGDAFVAALALGLARHGDLPAALTAACAAGAAVA